MRKQGATEDKDFASPIIDIQISQPLEVIVLRKKLLKMTEDKEDLSVKFMRAWKTNIFLELEKVNFEQLKNEFVKIKDGENSNYKDDENARKDAIKALSKSNGG